LTSPARTAITTPRIIRANIGMLLHDLSQPDATSRPVTAPGDEEVMLDSVDDPGDSADADSPDASPLTWPSANRILAFTCVVLVVLASVVAASEAFGPAAHSSEVRVPCFPLTLAHYGGDRACSRSRPCQVGAGDCDADSACRASLYCFKREQGEAVPGVNVTSIPDHVDVCYDPACE
jgi:hypothetical protein